MKLLRIIILLCLLFFAAFYTKLQRLESTAWVNTLRVSIYPINGDGDMRTDAYIKGLSISNFKAVDQFFKKQWNSYRDWEFEPVSTQLQEEVTSQPPMPPTDGNVLKIIVWSLRLRFWSYQHAIDNDKSSVAIFVRYHQVDDAKRLAHSLGLQKGLIGVVNAYASKDYQEKNNIVIAHELLHTVGAIDKYNLQTGQPIFPVGFAKPEKKYNQTKAELMAGKIPISEFKSDMPYSLRYCVVGKQTAKEIGWSQSD